MKKLLLSLGSIAAVIAPVASVVACGSATAAPSGVVKVVFATPKPPVVGWAHGGPEIPETVSIVKITSGADFHKVFRDTDLKARTGSAKSNPPVGVAFMINMNGHKTTFTWTHEDHDYVESLVKDSTWQRGVVQYLFSLTNYPEDADLILGPNHGFNGKKIDPASINHKTA